MRVRLSTAQPLVATIHPRPEGRQSTVWPPAGKVAPSTGACSAQGRVPNLHTMMITT